MAAVQPFSKTQDSRQRSDGAPPLSFEPAVPVVASLRRSLSMIPGDQCNRFDLIRFEAAKVAVPDEVIRVLVMAFVADVYADVMQQRGIFEPLALPVCQPMNTARL